ncbi:hypothetical protein RchiOBHm_Chr2g0175941 [Rosa chinensis]|uniref:Uncharacterized protein n=1 Tax=Rosa chinensis TaxID=74649 RepID=A0A2P6S6J3_ROSCH|nr:hypothetical protein RchiOBHm_Chr2g0175941 [Rosa chinensis]
MLVPPDNLALQGMIMTFISLEACIHQLPYLSYSSIFSTEEAVGQCCWPRNICIPHKDLWK